MAEKQNISKQLGQFNLSTVRHNEELGNYPYSTSERTRAVTFADVFDKGLKSQINLSVKYYNENGFYSQLIRHYSTLLLYKGLLTPHPVDNKFSKTVMSSYNKVLEAVDELNVPLIGKRISYQVLLKGTYYGMMKHDKYGISLIDLPFDYCKVVGRERNGMLVISFDTQYFNNKTDLLDNYPKEVQKHYYTWKRNKDTVSSTMILPPYLGVAFQLFSPTPYFLNSINDIDRYRYISELAKEREENDISEIIVQEIPHLNDGTLVFEPDEAFEMHKGVLAMTEGTKNKSVITTYGKVSLLSSPNRDTKSRNNIEQVNKDIYAGAGVSKELFSATTSAAIASTLKKDLSIMMTLGEQVATFIQTVINHFYGTKEVEYSYDILPITLYNQADYVNMTLSAANSGFSFFLPAIASGVNQRDLVNVKTLEDELGLKDLLQPLSSAFTQSSNSNDEGGRPELKDEEKSDKTVRNIEAGGEQ